MNIETPNMNPEMDEKTIVITREQVEDHLCPLCETSNTLVQLQKTDYRCSRCNLELAHLDYGPNDTIRGIFGWLLPVGEVVMDRYQIKQVLGKGGFGATYLVDDLKITGRRRALKEVPDLLFDEYEASLLSRLDHPAIPDIVDRLAANRMHYLVLKFGGSRTLGSERRASPDRRIPLAKLLPWMRQLCEVLSYLHSQNPPVIHRDLKPENILLNEEDRIMLIDFGIAKEVSTEHTRASASAVSESFSSPEQVAGTGTDVQADIYSLGATFYALLTGKNPPGAFTRLSGAELPPPSQLVPDVSPEVEAAIMQSLILRKEDRQQTVREFASALVERVWSDEPTVPRYSEPSVPVPPNPQHSKRAETVLAKAVGAKDTATPKPVMAWVGLAAILAAGIVISYTVYWGPKPDNTQNIAGHQQQPIIDQAKVPPPPPVVPIPTQSPEQQLAELTSQIKAGDSDPIAYTPDLVRQLDQYIPQLKSFPLSLAQEGIYRENDLIKFKLNLPSPGFLHVFIFEPNGKATLIFPSQYAKNNRVGPGIINLPNGKPPIIAGPPFGKEWLMAFTVADGSNLFEQYANDKSHVKEGLLELRVWEVLGFLQNRLADPATKAVGAPIQVCAKKGACP